MMNLIDQYLESKKLAWSPTTLRSEGHRLRGVVEALDGKPETLWAAIATRAPYTRTTMWTRVVSFYDWAIAKGHVQGPNKYREWRAENERQFKHVYAPKLPDISFDEAKARIARIEDPRIRGKALQLLMGGLRYSESMTLAEGRVIGKGNKPRASFAPEAQAPGCSYHTVLRALKAVGLTPHMLRKITATTLAQEGLREAELCEAMGWSSFHTAKNYVAANRKAIAAAFTKLQGGSTNDSTADDGEKQVS